MVLAAAFLLLGLSAASQALSVKRSFNCGGTTNYYTSNNGVIKSHDGIDHGHTYGKNMDCIWRIEAPAGMNVELVSQQFDVEADPACAYDYLVLFDGNSTNDPSLGKFCGSTFSPISSSQRFLTLVFVTDDDSQLSGFRLAYNFTTQVIHTCAASDFQCGSGRCIDGGYRCDGDDDCGDDSDEQGCTGTGTGRPGSSSCASDEFTCNNGNCVVRDWLCDGDDDCSDNSDELPQNCNAPVSNSQNCGVTNMTGSSGAVQSPGFPNTYPTDLNCIYYVQAPQGTKSLAFKFDNQFNIEDDAACAYDYVTIYSDGHSFTHGPFCGAVSPGQLTIPGDHAFIEFVTDDSDSYAGFRLDWKALQSRTAVEERKRFIVVPDTVPNCRYSLDVTDKGNIVSPAFGKGNYPPSTICTWRLNARRGETIHLHFNMFSVESSPSCKRDMVRIMDGVSGHAHSLGQYCGQVIPPDIHSTSNGMTLIFYSDDSFEDTGFNATYTVVQPPVPTELYKDDGCHGDTKYLNGSHGIITSPGYDGYTYYDNNEDCSWLIVAPPGQVVVIQFQDFLTESIAGCNYDYVAVYDGANNQSTELGRFCGLQFPDDITSSGQQLSIRFRSDPDVSGKGFSLSYTFRAHTQPCHMFQCRDGSCILEDMVCNNWEECMDHTDEVICDATGTCGRPAIAPAETNSKIVGGREAIPNSWPWMVSLRVNGSHTCGGALIADQWVLTAAHCFERYRRAVDWSVAAGKHSETKPETTVQILNVTAIVVNSHYNFLSHDTDIAVVKVDRPFAMNTYVNKVCLPTAAAVAGTTGIVTGWGYVGATCCPGVLKQALLPIISNKLCNQPDHLGNQVTDNMFCAGYEAGGHDACQGDSGGPLVTKNQDVWQIQGITSFGSGCADVRSPGVYTEVFNYISWIRQKVALNS